MQADAETVDSRVLEAIHTARMRIADSLDWTSGAVARSADGTPVHRLSSAAVCWCACGAVVNAMTALSLPPDLRSELWSLLNKAIFEECQMMRHIEWVNDNMGHSVVLSIFDRALSIAGQ